MLKSHKYLPLVRPYVNKKALKQQQANVIHEKNAMQINHFNFINFFGIRMHNKHARIKLILIWRYV